MILKDYIDDIYTTDYKQIIRSIQYKQHMNYQDAEDSFQSAIEKLLQININYTDKEHCINTIIQAATWSNLNYKRHTYKELLPSAEQQELIEATAEADSSDIINLIDYQSLMQTIQSLLGTSENTYKTLTIVQLLQQGYKQKEIAKILGVCVQNVNNTVKRLRTKLEEKGYGI